MAKQRRTAGTFRMTISIPLAIKDRMDQCEGVTWSHIAAQAFEDYLVEAAPTAMERKQAKEWKKIVTEIHELTNQLRVRSSEAIEAALKSITPEPSP